MGDSLYLKLKPDEAKMVRMTIKELEEFGRRDPLGTLATSTIRYLLMREVMTYEEAQEVLRLQREKDS